MEKVKKKKKNHKKFMILFLQARFRLVKEKKEHYNGINNNKYFNIVGHFFLIINLIMDH
jgi:hypothetical protein